MLFLVEAFFSGCVSKIVNDGTDYSKSTIQSVIFDKKNQDFSTKIYRVIEKALNASTYNKYKNKDILYDATEKLFLNFKENENNIKAVKACLNRLIPDVDNIMCEKFIEKFFDGICRDDYLFKRVTLILKETGVKYSQNEFSQLIEIIKGNHEEIIGTIGSLNGYYNGNEKGNIIKEIEFRNNKKQDYIKNWNSRLFLHMYNNKNPITLADAFIMPDYMMLKKLDIMEFSNADTLNKIIKKFICYKKTSTLLIMGVPGIGKSSIVSWIANQYKKDKRIIILKFRDWENEDLKKGLLRAICNTLECSTKDLDNKILIIDGFDEIKSLNRGEEIFNGFINNIKDLENFKCIITSRPTYIDPSYFSNVLNLKEFDINKIDDFCQKITGRRLYNKEKIQEYSEVLGIPVILYMAIMSNVNISKNPTKPELYNRVFSEKGGIFDKFFDGEVEYSSGSQILRDPSNIKKYLNFLRDISFEMFEKNNLSLEKADVEIPELEFQGSFVSVLDFPIKYLFESTQPKIEFVHKSIYEYFLSEYFFYSLREIDKDINRIEEAYASILGRLLVKNELFVEMIEFLKYKSRREEDQIFNYIQGAFKLMLINGMTYYTNEHYKNIIGCELRVFSNMLELMHVWDKQKLDVGILIKAYIEKSMVWKEIAKVNLAGANLEGINLSGMKLMKMKLSLANLCKANLDEIDLSEADLSGADLSEVILKKATLRKAKLINANLEKANLSNANLFYADLRNANLQNAILIQTYLESANLGEANLSGANLIKADLSGVNLVRANLSGADIRKADLERTNLEEANLRNIRYSQEQVRYLEKFCDLEILNAK